MSKRELQREIRRMKRRLATLDKKLAGEYAEEEKEMKSEDEELMEEIESMEAQLEDDEDEVDEELEDELIDSLEDVSKETEEELFEYSGKSDDQVQEILDVDEKGQDIETVVDKPESEQEALDIEKPDTVLARYQEASRRLDRVAEALEAQGNVKMAYRVDKVADTVDREIKKIKFASRRKAALKRKLASRKPARRSTKRRRRS